VDWGCAPPAAAGAGPPNLSRASLFGGTPAAQSVPKTKLDFFRISLSGDTASRGRPRADATVGGAAKYDGNL
jgi:hypothetical protein